jgi:hypothetical protein
MRRAPPPPIPDLSLVVPGRLRHWVAEAIFAEVARNVETEQGQGARRRRRVKPVRTIADELRDIAARIQP